MYLELQKRLGAQLRSVLKAKYGIEVENIPLETPPDLKFGELATPIAFELARKLRKAPKVIAQEIVSALGAVDGFCVDLRLRALDISTRGWTGPRVRGWLRAWSPTRPEKLAKDWAPRRRDAAVHSLVEHTSINPNKAAHIGHLRNAILGDTFVRLLRAAGQKVDVQNYIDNTGVQVADVVVGFLHVEGKSLADVRALLEDLKRSGQRIDYYCWDLYAHTSQWYTSGTGSRERGAEEAALRDAARD